MTELTRTTKNVDEIERLVQSVLERGEAAEVLRLSQLVGNTIPVMHKLRNKAEETDPMKQMYNPQTREKVRALVARWEAMEGLARDVLQQRGSDVATAGSQVTPAAAPAPAQPTTWTRVELPPVQPSSGQPVLATGTGPTRSSSGSSGAVAAPSQPQRGQRELAAAAAEKRLQTASATSSGTGAAAPATAPAAAANAGRASQIARVARMDALLHLVHCVFLGHGFKRQDDSENGTQSLADHTGMFRVSYVHGCHKPVTATYVPVQNHLVVYAALQGAEGAPMRVSVQLGMPAQSVQAKVDYLLLYPLTSCQCLPSLVTLPTEVCFSFLTNLALPSMKAVGCASRGLKSAVFEDDILWWRVLLALPPSSQLLEAQARVRELEQRGEVLPAGLCLQLVRDEVARARHEAEEQQRRHEAERRMRERMRDQMRDPLLVQPPRQPPRFPGNPFGGNNIIGGDRDLMPGGGFMPGGRRPFGGGGGGFGGLPF